MPHTPSSTDFVGSTTTDRLASMAHETIDRVTPKVNRAEHDVRDAATKAADGAKHLQEKALAATKDSLHKVRAYVDDNPLTTAAIAFAAGALLSALFRR